MSTNAEDGFNVSMLDVGHEHDLLMMFLDNKDLALTRDQILDNLWGSDYEGYDRTVDTHIKKLRKALGKAGDHIEMVIKVGYVWKKK